MLTFFFCFFLVCCGISFVVSANEKEKMLRMSPETKAKYITKKRQEAESFQHGPINLAIICPHCSQKGKVHTKSDSRKAGVGGGKATGAILTGGVSLLATGLSRKEKGTQAYCGNCKSAWFFT